MKELAFTGNTEIARELSMRIANFYRERPDSIVLIPKRDKYGRVIGNVPEITRPLALMLWQYLVKYVAERGGSLAGNVEVLHADSERIVVKATAVLEIGGQRFQYAEVGEAVVEGQVDETTARKAYTRAFKRLMEQIVGEDFINRTVLALVEASDVETSGSDYDTGMQRIKKETPATERQKQILKDFIKKGKITDTHIQELIEEGVLPKDFNLEEAIEKGDLTYAVASSLLQKGGLTKRK